MHLTHYSSSLRRTLLLKNGLRQFTMSRCFSFFYLVVEKSYEDESIATQQLMP